MNQIEEAKLIEKNKRKEVAKVRVFWFLVILCILMIGYIAIQFIMLSGAK